jgi:hypothetical protein
MGNKQIHPKREALWATTGKARGVGLPKPLDTKFCHHYPKF